MNGSTVEGLLAEAAAFVEQYEYQAAVDKFHEAYQLEPDNTMVLDNLSEVLLEIGQLLQRSIELKPEEGVSKYMNLGQITSGHDAVAAFNKGIELLRKELASKSRRGEAKTKGIRKRMVSAMVAISEIYMTDLCDEEDAEQTCSDCLEEALTVDPSSWEALQALASFRISQQNPEDALLQLTRSYEIWKELEPEDIDSPSYDARVAASKLFVELEAYEMGAEVLESLLEDNDEDAETWYLCAFCYSHTDVTSAPECLETAKKLLKKQKIEEPTIHKQVDDLTVIVAEKLASLGISADEIPSNGGQPEFDSDTEFMDE